MYATVNIFKGERMWLMLMLYLRVMRAGVKILWWRYDCGCKLHKWLAGVLSSPIKTLSLVNVLHLRAEEVAELRDVVKQQRIAMGGMHQYMHDPWCRVQYGPDLKPGIGTHGGEGQEKLNGAMKPLAASIGNSRVDRECDNSCTSNAQYLR
jgi:hypothetical protein